MYFDNISRYVRDGGAVLIAAGPDYANDGSLYDTPLAPVLPVAPTGKVIEEPFFPGVTDLGKRHPVTRDLDGSQFDPPHWGRWFRQIDVEKPEGEVIMKGAEDKPLLVLNRVEKGRVALLLSDNAWLWARGFEGGGPHVDLLRRLACLDDRERTVLRLRYGLEGATPQTLKEIGARLGITREWVRKIELRAVSKLEAAASQPVAATTLKPASARRAAGRKPCQAAPSSMRTMPKSRPTSYAGRSARVAAAC